MLIGLQLGLGLLETDMELIWRGSGLPLHLSNLFQSWCSHAKIEAQCTVKTKHAVVVIDVDMPPHRDLYTGRELAQ